MKLHLPRSIFSRYISAFMLLFFICFTLLGVILAMMVSDYAMKEKRESVQNAVENVKEMLNKDYYAYLEETNAGDVASYLRQEAPTIARSMSAVSDYSKFFLFLVDEEGEILITDTASGDLQGRIPEAAVAELFQRGREGKISEVGDLDGLLPASHVIYGAKLGLNLRTGVPAGAVIGCSSSTELSSFVSRLLSTMLTSCVIVMVAGLLACYILSERISAPIRSMSKAARSFAMGDFSVRIPEQGRDEVAELARAFNNMAVSLAQLEDMRSGFLSNVAHDLRTPMTTISGFIDGILDGVIPPEKYEYYLQIVGTEVKRLSRLVATLLDITRMQAGERKYHMAPFNICETARQILLSFESKIEEKSLRVEFNCEKEDLAAMGDEDAIHQVLYNLIDNAVKFARPQGLLSVTILRKDRKIFVSVYNEGEGISAEDLPRVFDRFYKADRSRGLDKSGMGLGMFIAKTILLAHQESITVQSEEGKWCEFRFSLTPAPAAKGTARLSAGSEGRRS